MARLPRLTVTGYPHHVILRGNNRQDIFRTADDYQRMLDLLFEHSRAHKVDIHAYVLMGNHLHLLLTPQEDQGLPKMMQAVGRSYVQMFNKVHARTGTLWEGRYRSTLIQTDRYLLACMAYIDLNPVRAHMVARPEDYVCLATGTTQGIASTGSSRLMRWFGAWAIRRSRVRRHTPKWCAQASAWTSRVH
jgi:putative transposase